MLDDMSSGPDNTMPTYIGSDFLASLDRPPHLTLAVLGASLAVMISGCGLLDLSPDGYQGTYVELKIESESETEPTERVFEGNDPIEFRTLGGYSVDLSGFRMEGVEPESGTYDDPDEVELFLDREVDGETFTYRHDECAEPAPIVEVEGREEGLLVGSFPEQPLCNSEIEAGPSHVDISGEFAAAVAE